MAILASIGAVLAAKCTFTYLTECIIDSSTSSFIGKIPKLGERLRKQFSDTKPEVNHHLQKAILSSHWMATLVFVEQMHKKNLLSESYNNVNITIQNELKRLQEDTYLLDEISPDAYDAAKLIKLPKEEDVISKLKNDILEYHLTQLNSKTGRVKELNDYQQLLHFIKNGWQEEDLNWFSLMTAFLNQLLKGDNNNAKDAFQNQALASIQLKLENFEQYAKTCVSGIGEERFNSFVKALFDEIAKIQNSLSGLHQKQDKTFKVVSSIESSLQRIENRLGESKHLDLNVFEQYRQLISDIDALKIEIEAIEEEKKETLEFIAEEENERKKLRFEKDLVNLEEEQLKLRFEIEEKQKKLDTFISDIQRVWISVYTENSPRLILAREALENGDIDKANSILDDRLLQDDFELIEKLDAVLLQKKEALAQEYITKAELTVTQKSSLDWFEKADGFYEKAVALYSSCDTCFTYSYFLYEHNQFNRALTYYKKALDYSTNDEQKADTLNNLGNLQSYTKELGEAEKSYQEALEIKRKLAQGNPKTYLPDVATILNNLGVLQSDQNKLGEAKKSYQEALEIYRKLTQENPKTYLNGLANTLNNLGNLQSDQNELAEAEKSYQDALEIYRKLAQENPKTYLPSVANTLNNLGNLQSDQNELAEAEKSYQDALEIYRKLAQENPKTYLPSVAKTLNNLGILQNNQNKLGEAEKCYLEALEISRKLAQENPKTYLPDVATTQNNLGTLQRDQNELGEAEKSYLEALAIRRKLAQENPTAFSIDYASTAMNLAILYRYNLKDKEKSIYYALIAIQYFSPFSATVHFAAQWQKIAEEILKIWGGSTS